MVRGLSAIGTQVASGTEQSLQQIVEKVMADEIKSRYVDIALSPDRFLPALHDAVERAVAATRHDLELACADLRGRFAALLTENASTVEIRTGPDRWLPDPGWRNRIATNAFCAQPGRHVTEAAADLEARYGSTFGSRPAR